MMMMMMIIIMLQLVVFEIRALALFYISSTGLPPTQLSEQHEETINHGVASFPLFVLPLPFLCSFVWLKVLCNSGIMPNRPIKNTTSCPLKNNFGADQK